MREINMQQMLRHVYFDGSTYDPDKDRERLGTQLQRVFKLMSDGRWRTLTQISRDCGGSEASISARLRDLRKTRFGSHLVDRRRTAFEGVWEYRLIVTFDRQRDLL